MNQLHGSCKFASDPLQEHEALLTAKHACSTKCVLFKYVLLLLECSQVRIPLDQIITLQLTLY